MTQCNLYQECSPSLVFENQMIQFTILTTQIIKTIYQLIQEKHLTKLNNHSLFKTLSKLGVEGNFFN